MFARKRLAAFAAVVGATAFASARTDAFCGFYVSGADTKLFNNATQVVLMREGTRTVLSMQNNYQGPPTDFAMVVPVPVILQKENVKTLKNELFTHVDQLDSPRLVEYWEMDPCQAPELPRPSVGGMVRKKSAAPAAAEPAANHGVTVEAQFTVGEYEIVILSAKDAGGLDTWLREQKYKIPEGSEPFFRPYVQSGSKFFVARVDSKKVSFDAKGMATLSPLRFHYDSEQFSLPVRLGLVNSGGTQDLIVHILAKGQRYEVANYPNATIPTNLDVSENARGEFGPFYAALFDRTIEKNPKAVVTEYAWDASTCDPCPGPALSGADLKTLGADVLPSASPFPSGFVVTRLHARYGKESLGEDLVFRAAPPIVGGREVRTNGTDLEHGASASSLNNFQGRYAIRHPWGGPIECKNPVRNRWGGPPAGKPGPTGPTPATNLAFVKRDAKLASFVRSTIPELDVKGEGAPVSSVGTKPEAGSVAANDAGAPASPYDPKTSPSKGCGGCASGESGGARGAFALAALVLAFVRRRRSTCG